MRRNKVLASIVLAACALTSIASHAQDRGPRDDHGRPGMERDHRDDHRGPDRDEHHAPGPDGRGHWQRGERVPTEYRQHQYVVDDWRGHHLAAPPRGQQWVAVGGDYFLIAVATGIVASAIFAH
jgi:Ni/Co efflux regulator RcnB